MAELFKKLVTLKRTLSDEGALGVLHRLRWWLRNRAENRNIAEWLKEHGRCLTAEEKESLRERIAGLQRVPLISIVMPVYDVDERWLRRAIESVTVQVYPTWELCIADDCSSAPHIRRVLEEYASKDERIKVVYRETNGHISAASNSALELATGEFVALLDHDDELTEDALFHVAAAINEHPHAEMFYSDEDMIDESGRRFEPKLKPAWSRDLFYSVNYVTHFAVYRTERLREAGGFRLGFEGSQDYDLALRVLEKIGDEGIRHIPHVLYHWRAIPGSVGLSGNEKPYAHERARAAIREHFKRTGVEAQVSETWNNLHRVSYDARSTATFEMISVDPDRDLDGVLSVTDLAAKLNAEARIATEDVLVFLDDGIFHSDLDDIRELAGFAMQPEIGAVGGRIIAQDHLVEEAGLVLDPDLTPHASHGGYPKDAPGNIYRNQLISNYSAISAACFAIRRELFEEMGGFDTSSELFDVDLCLRLRERGKRIVVVPQVELERKLDAAVRQSSTDGLARFRRRWLNYVTQDPFCNPNLKRDGSFEIDV